MVWRHVTASPPVTRNMTKEGKEMKRAKIVAATLLTAALAVPTATAVAAGAYGGGAHA